MVEYPISGASTIGNGDGDRTGLGSVFGCASMNPSASFGGSSVSRELPSSNSGLAVTSGLTGTSKKNTSSSSGVVLSEPSSRSGTALRGGELELGRDLRRPPGNGLLGLPHAS